MPRQRTYVEQRNPDAAPALPRRRMAEGARFDVRQDEGLVVLSVRGELDVAAGAEYENARDEAMASGLPIVLDLTECGFLDSQGIAAVMRTFKLAGQNRQAFALAGSGPPIGRLLDLTGLASLMPCFERLEDAVEHARRSGADGLAGPAGNGAADEPRP